MIDESKLISPLHDAMKCSATFDTKRIFRYELVRQWDENLPFVNFIGLNPSTADENVDDPTIRRCIKFAERFHAGGLRMTNLFAIRATDPKDMMKSSNPVGEDGIYLSISGIEFANRNDLALWHAHKSSIFSIAAWGNLGSHLYRAAKVKRFITDLKCLGKTSSGQPKHPLYLKSDTDLINL